MIRAAALLIFLGSWAVVAHGNRALEAVPASLLPTPGEVATVFAALAGDGSLARDLLVSSRRIAEGFVLAALAAGALGVVVALSAPVRLMLQPVIEFVRPIPPLAFLPMFLVWFGLGETSKVAFIAYTTFFPMFVGADAGMGNLIMEGRTFFNPAQIVMGALLLGVLGSLVSALLVAIERRALRWRGEPA